MSERLRIGTLGAARITPAALVKPAREVADAEVVAVAARDRDRAAKFAEKHGIPRVHDSYDELLADPEIDAIYNPLPNGLHAEWTIAALAAGKHVLCEKPFTSNATEAEAVQAKAAETGLVVMEAFHYRYHPLAQRMHEVVNDGTLGAIQHVETSMCFPLLSSADIRWQYELGGGAAMDVGAYSVHQARLLGGGADGAEPTVTAARARLKKPKVDRWLQADLRWPAGHTGTATCAMWSSTVLKMVARVRGERGELRVFNPTGPHYFHRFTLVVDGRKSRESFPRRATYTYQLEAFTAAVLRGEPTLTPPADSVANMRVIDASYVAAGLPVRGAVDEH